jgi:lysophospholipid acyltransferase (LPLAT)-like uncharacterized protein
VSDTDLGWRTSKRKQFEIAAIGAIGVPVIHGLGRTWRWRVDGRHHLDGIITSGRQPIMAFWHGRILPSIYHFRRRDIVVITSDNFDGEWVARIIHRFGFSTVRGSTSRNAARAALKAKRRMEEGCAVGITVDGPRGPARIVQPGAVWLAKATGNPILPFHIEASSFWLAPSWDSTQVPYPFSRIAVVFDEPLWVPGDAEGPELDRWRTVLEQRLLALEPRARALVGRESPNNR